MNIAGFLVDISNPDGWNFTGTSVIPEHYHGLPRGNLIYLYGNTPHIWTPQQIHNQTNPYKLPCAVYGGSFVDGAANGAEFVAVLKKHNVPTGVRVVLDMENLIDDVYVNEFIKAVESAGYLLVTYGSLSTVFKNPCGKGGYFSASWSNVIHIDNGAWADQYANSAMLGHPFDISVVTSWEHVWNTSAPTPPPVTHPAIMVRASYSKDGGKSWQDFTVTPNSL